MPLALLIGLGAGVLGTLALSSGVKNTVQIAAAVGVGFYLYQKVK